MNTQQPASASRRSLLDRPLRDLLAVRVEVLIFAIILLLAVFTRFYHLGERVMSHDESLHTYFSWQLYKGNGYQHNPMMHGPLQFHLIALSFFLFGDNDFTARLPHALAAVAAIAFLWAWRRYLGRKGALIAAGLMVISPYMLYYGRYARNEALIMPLALVMWWAVLRYLETGANRYLTWLTASLALHFVTKETAFIYTAQLLLFLGLLLLDRLSRVAWPRPEQRRNFFAALLVAAAAVAFAVAAAMALHPAPSPIQTTQGAAAATTGGLLANPAAKLFLLVALLALIAALVFLFLGLGWKRLLQERAFVLMLLIFTLVMPQLAPLPMAIFHWDALDYSASGIFHSALFIVPLVALAIAAGMAWDAKVWLQQAALFYAIFAVFQTTVFTNGSGFFSGLVGALGYWLQQQGVHRGSQPWYYYLLIQVPIYEYLPALGSLGAMLWWALHRRQAVLEETTPEEAAKAPPQSAPVFAFLAFWVITAFAAYTVAGEKMPWLTVHIALPMILLTAWWLDKIIAAVDWRDFAARRGWVLVGLAIMFILAVAQATGALAGTHRPFQGMALPQLQDTANFLVGVLVALASGAGLAVLSARWRTGDLARLFGLSFFGLLALLTLHTAVQATYYNYDQANEYLVYAHSARGVKTVMRQVREISERTTDGLGIQVAYDDAIAWPFTWYLRNYPNQKFYGNQPGGDLRDVPIVLVGAANFGKVESIVSRNFERFDYIRMVWPNQDYFGLTWQRIAHALRDPAMREALFHIWLNRDFTTYFRLQHRDDPAAAAKVNMANILADWQPSDRMRMYIRKDIVAKIWDYGAAPTTQAEADPYAQKQTVLTADKVLGTLGVEPGQFQRPRGVAVAPDGTLYIADTGNHRIQHLTADGQVLEVWGRYGNLMDGGPEAAPPGTFNEPWGIAVGPDGSVYVADTWNHRIQKFDAHGKFLTMWGRFGNDGNMLSLWGPRDVVVDAAGHVFVTDTGNKRIVVYSANGEPLAQFGHGGAAVGEFSEPVGLALDAEGNLYVADTWNQRVQVFSVSSDWVFAPLRQWEIYGWFGQSLDNKPYLAVDAEGHVFAGDPEGYRVLEFDDQGNLVRWWGQWGAPPEGIGLVGGLAVDGHGGLWVADAEHGQILHFMPEMAAPVSP